MDENQTPAVAAQAAPANNSNTAAAVSAKKQFSVSRFFVGITGEDYDDVVTYKAKARYVTIGFMTLMDPLLSWYLFTMAASLNNSMGTAAAIGFGTALIIFLIEMALVRTTPLGGLYKLFTGKVKGSAIAFFLISFIMRGGIAYALGAINAPRAVVVMYQDGIDAYTQKIELAKREADIKDGRARRDSRNAQARESEAKLSESEEDWKREMTQGGNGRKDGRGTVSNGLEDVKKSQEQRWKNTEEAHKIANAKEEAEATELKKLANNAKSDDYVTKSKTLEEMAETNLTIRHEISLFHWLCILVGVLAFVTKSMLPPGAYERFKESREEQLIAQIEINALNLTQKLSEAKLRESEARQKIGNAEKQILLADPISYMKKYATEAYKLIKKITDKGRQEAARKAIDGHINKAVDHTLNYTRVQTDLDESMPKT